MKKINKKLLIIILFIVIMLTGIITGFAKDKFSPTIKSISDGDSNGTYAKDIKKEINNMEAVLTNSFEQPGDELSYEVVLENTGSKYGILKDINITSSNNKMKYTVEGIKVDDKLDANSRTKFIVKAKVVSDTLSKGSDTAKFSLTFVDEDGKIIKASNPNTIDNIIKYIVILIISTLIIFFIVKKNKKEIIEIIAILLFVGITGVSAASKGTIIITMDVDIDPITPWDGEVATTCFEKGSGTESDPYQIKNGAQLACFSKSVNEGNKYEGQYIKLIKDIALNSKVLENNELVSDTSSLNIWTPIGHVDNGTNYTFNGTFDGDNKSIGGIYIKTNTNNQENYNGLFGSTENSTIKNLQINDSYIEGNNYTGILNALVTNGIEVNNIETNGVVNMEEGNTSAGIVGYATGDSSTKVKINNTVNNAAISTVAYDASGLIGYVDGPSVEITNSGNNGNISPIQNANIYATGLVSQISSGENLKIKNCFNTGNMTGASATSGLAGIISSVNNIEIKDSYNTGNIYANGNYAGGILGHTTWADEAIVDNCYNTGDVYATGGYAGGLVGESNDTPITVTNSYNKGNVEIPESQSYAGGIIAATSGDAIVEECFNEGEIKGYYGTGGIVGKGNNTSVSIKDSYNAGRINYGIPRTSDFGNNVIYIGGIIGASDVGTIENCHNSGDVYAIMNAGGIAGNYSGTITDSYNTGTVDGEMYIGGILGSDQQNNALVKKSYNKGLIRSYNEYGVTPMYIGGIAGKGKDVEDSYNVGAFDVGGMYIAGIVGSGNVKNSYNASELVVTKKVQQGVYMIAGITGEGNVDKSYNTGNIKIKVNNATQISVGGITSFGTPQYQITNSCNTGNIEIDYSQSYEMLRAAGIAGVGNSRSTGNYTSGRIDIAEGFTLDNPSRPVFVGAIFGQYQDNPAAVLLNRYVKYDDVFTNYAVGTSRYDLPELLVTTANDTNFGTKIEKNDPSILSIINGNNSFKEDTNNINNGYPILK